MITKLTTTDGKEYTLFHQELCFDQDKLVFNEITLIPDELLLNTTTLITDSESLIIPTIDVKHFESI